MLTQSPLSDETLDPADWTELRTLGHRMLDDIFTYLETVRERPVWQPMPDEVREQFHAPLPMSEQPVESVYEEFQRNVLAYPLGNIHPRFWGWVMGNNTPVGVLADMLASGLNPNMGGADHAANHVEMQVIDWCKEIMGFPQSASGLLVSGGSMANLLGLAVARHAKAGFDIRQQGVGASPKPMTMYVSTELHSSLQRAVEVLGLGNWSLRRIPADDQFRINVDALERTIKSDQNAGLHPICIIGNAGTVNTGAIDPLDALADIAARYNLWFHVDGAFGALANMSPELRPLLTGMDRADSIAFDLHKWVYLPFEAGCVLVRDSEMHRNTFTLTPDYLKHGDRGTAGGPIWFSDYGIQLSRGFRALKVWMAFKTYGIDKIGRVIAQNVGQAQYLEGLIEKDSRLELVAPVSLNIVCFRYRGEGVDEAHLNALNAKLLILLQESGIAVPTGTSVNGRYALRCAITNHRSRLEDFDTLVEHVLRIGDSLV